MLIEKLQEITNSLISVVHPFANISLYLVKFENIQFIGIHIWLVPKVTNGYSASLEYSVYFDSHSNFKFEGEIKFIAVT